MTEEQAIEERQLNGQLMNEEVERRPAKEER